MPDDLQRALTVMARELLGRTEMEPELIEETAGRLQALAGTFHLLEDLDLQDVTPALSFNSLHPAFHTGSQLDPGALPGGNDKAGNESRSGAMENATQVDPMVRGKEPVVCAGDELGQMTLIELVQAIQGRRLSATEVVRRCLDQAEKLGPQLNAFITLLPEPALNRAAAIDKAIAAGEDTGLLAGAPVGFKDLHYIAGVPTTAASKILRDFVPETTGTVVQRITDAGAICIGKLNTHQFALGATSESSDWGPVRNPWNPDHSAGGSSGGSGAAVAARILPFASGTDTGGSVRIPAAACGVFGIKPTFGRVSNAGMISLAWSLDHVGPFTRSVADAALVLGVMAGEDPRDHTTLPVPVPDYVAAVRRAQQEGIKGMRVGLAESWLARRVDPAVAAAVRRAVEELSAAGAQVEVVQLPDPAVMTFANRLVLAAEAAAYHAPFLQRHAHLYAPDVRARLVMGQFLPSRYYILAQRLKSEFTRIVNQQLRQVDVIVTPTLPVGAHAIGAASVSFPDGDEAPGDALVRFTSPFNLTGHPAASVPFGFAGNGMPAAVQVIGGAFREEDVFRVAAVLEQKSNFS